MRAEALARLFEAVHEGIYSGVLDRVRTSTLAANPHLKLMLGFAPETPEADVRPFDPARFDDAEAGQAFVRRLLSEGVVTDYLLRIKRADARPVWLEVTAHAEPYGPDDAIRVDALIRDVSERKK